MDDGFKAWLLADFAKLEGSDLNDFLLMLKFRTEELIHKISLVIMDYVPVYVGQTHRVCHCNRTTDPRELVRALKVQFEEHLKTINA